MTAKAPFCVDPDLERAAQLAEQRKRQAIDKLAGLLHRTPEDDKFGRAMAELIDADKGALRERGR